MDYGIGDAFVPDALEQVSFALADFRADRMEGSPYASGMDTRRSIPKYRRYHRPIARPALFWLNVTEENSMATMNASTKLTQRDAPAKPAQIRVTRRDVENRLGYYLGQIGR